MKYIVVSGGVVSGLGKGITSSSFGLLLKNCGLRVTHIKVDPYLNIDAGVLSPFEHGETFVLDDGGEVDLDLGNYERFCGVRLTRDHNITSGKIYQSVISRERVGEYLGKTVQVVPHVTDAVQQWIERVAKIPVDGSKISPDVCIIELGGTVGDIESGFFLEALRQFKYKLGGNNFCLAHVALVPEVGGDREQKSKPTQHSIVTLRAAGLSPDLILCRSRKALDRSAREKIAQSSMVPEMCVLSIPDCGNIYEVPLLMLQQRVPSILLSTLHLNKAPPDDLPAWRRIAHTVSNAPESVTIALVGKYTTLSDSYLSVTKALLHSCVEMNLKLHLLWVESGDLEPVDVSTAAASAGVRHQKHEEAWKTLKSAAGIIMPGGFGDRGIEGMVAAVEYARTANVPFFGICLGMQVAVIEYARNVCGFAAANSAEFDAEKKSQHHVVIYMPEVSQTHMGGTMRLGSRDTIIAPGTLAHQIYRAPKVAERHRHRYEVNPEYVERLKAAGLVFSGQDDTGARMEITELPSHRFFIGSQYHPEFLSRPSAPSPIFLAFIQASAGSFTRLDAAVPHPTPCPSPAESTRVASASAAAAAATN